MNSVKYNNWKDALREHAPAGLDKEAAWLKLQQRNRPASKRRKWLPWLAAACLCGIAVPVFFIKGGNKTVATKSNTVQPVNNTTVEQQKTFITNNASPEPVNYKEPVPDKHLFHPSAQAVKAGQNILQKEPGVIATNNPEENKPAPVVENTPPLIATVQPSENNKPAAKPAMKIVHLNELNAQPDMAQQTVPEEKTTPKFPLSRPTYARAKYDAEQEQPPPVKQKKSFGLPRSLASLKD